MVRFPNEIVGIELIGPLLITVSGNPNVLVIVDLCTKLYEAIPLEEVDVVTKVRDTRWEVLLQLDSDHRPNFESRIKRALCKLLSIRKSKTTTYHSESNEQAKRTN